MAEPNSLTLYVIHTQQLTTRQSRLHGTIQTIRQTAQALGQKYQTILILKPDPQDLMPNIAALNARVSYESVNDPLFDATKHVLNIEEISNLEKHREAWRRIQVLPPNSRYMVIEDDNILPPENVAHLAVLLQQPADTWDFLDLNMSTSADQMTLNPIYQHAKILTSKQAYMISPKAASLLLRETETIRFTTRVHISHAIQKYKDGDLKKAYFPSKRVMLEGSKVGVYPSSLHANNMPVYNAEYMELWNMWTAAKDDVSVIQESKVRDIFKTVEHVGNSDLFYLYGRILQKLGHTKEALTIWERALEEHGKQQGMMNQQSDLLQDVIRIHESLQSEEVTDCMRMPSKYKVSR